MFIESKQVTKYQSIQFTEKELFEYVFNYIDSVNERTGMNIQTLKDISDYLNSFPTTILTMPLNFICGD